jgi:hypothetical protein
MFLLHYIANPDVYAKFNDQYKGDIK